MPQRVSGAALGGKLVAQRLRVETPISPGDLPVIDGLVIDAEVVEGAEQPEFDTVEQMPAVDQVVVAQAEDVRLVRALRRGREPQQKARARVLQQAPLGGRRGVVEFISTTT